MHALVAVLFAFVAPAQPPAEPSAAADAVRRLEAHNRSVRDVSARFTQSYRSGLIGREIVERGTLRIKRPGRMLWEYTEPERKTFVSDGRTIWFYVPADRQVIVREQAGERGVALSLLAGEAGLLEQFEASYEGRFGGLTRIRLQPRRQDPEVDGLVIELDAAFRIVSIDITDVQGNRSRFRFEAVRENVGMDDRLFEFELPKGVEVVAG
jgi:outer membrane lipoprotein carrier protein